MRSGSANFDAILITRPGCEPLTTLTKLRHRQVELRGKPQVLRGACSARSSSELPGTGRGRGHVPLTLQSGLDHITGGCSVIWLSLQGFSPTGGKQVNRSVIGRSDLQCDILTSSARAVS